MDCHIEESGDADKAAATIEALKELSAECSINKVYSSEAVEFVADEMLQVHGGYGFIAEYHAERHYRDARITASGKARPRSTACSSPGCSSSAP